MKTVLIATLGGSPQVVTETLWALMNPGRTATPRPPEARRVPARIHMIATGHIAHLEEEVRRRIDDLYRGEGLEPLPRRDVKFDVVTDDAGAPLDDIRTGRDNDFFSRHIAVTVRGYARDEGLRVHVSLAGGRKTMSSHALSAAMFFGRPHDEVSHVLVNPRELESHPGFWWPGQPAGEVEMRGSGKRVSTAVGSASIELILTPFVPLAPFLPDGAPEEATDPETLARRVRSYLRADRLVVDFKSRTLSTGEETPIVLSNQLFALYALLAIARARGWPGAGPGGVGEDHRGWIARRDYLDPGRPAAAALVALYTGTVLATMAEKGDEEEDSPEWKLLKKFMEGLCRKMIPETEGEKPKPDPVAPSWSKLKNEIAAKAPNYYVRYLLIPSFETSGGRAAYRHGLALPAEKIDLRNVPSDFAVVEDALGGMAGIPPEVRPVLGRLLDEISHLPEAFERR